MSTSYFDQFSIDETIIKQNITPHIFCQKKKRNIYERSLHKIQNIHINAYKINK